MKNWLDDPTPHLFEIIEHISPKRHEVWHMKATNREMHDKIKGLEDMNGYIPGLGGNKYYTVVCWQMDY